jgi:lactose/L-arabinose transport system ATP-binding protein
VREPEVFLFDEPLSNLDAELRVQMRVEIARPPQRARRHDDLRHPRPDEAMTLASRIVVLRAGRVEQVGAPLDLYDDPENRFVAGFIGSPRMNFLQAEALGGSRVRLVHQGGAELTLPIERQLLPGTRLAVGVRPEHFAAEGAGDCDLPLTLDVAEHLGATSYLYANTKSGEPVVAQAAAARGAGAGDRVAVSIPAARAFAFDEDGARLR